MVLIAILGMQGLVLLHLSLAYITEGMFAICGIDADAGTNGFQHYFTQFGS